MLHSNAHKLELSTKFVQQPRGSHLFSAIFQIKPFHHSFNNLSINLICLDNCFEALNRNQVFNFIEKKHQQPSLSTFITGWFGVKIMSNNRQMWLLLPQIRVDNWIWLVSYIRFICVCFVSLKSYFEEINSSSLAIAILPICRI